MINEQIALHKCRDCQTTDLAPMAILCTRCKAAAGEKRKARKRERARESYNAKQQTKKAPEPGLPRVCATSGCDNKVEGKTVYCPSCRHSRQLQHQKYYRENKKPMNDDAPTSPPTSLKWLDKFSGWAHSGMSYAAYQKAAMEQRDKASPDRHRANPPGKGVNPKVRRKNNNVNTMCLPTGAESSRSWTGV